MNKLRIILASLLASIAALAGVFALATPAHALFEGAKDQACNGANLTDNGGCNTSDDSSSKVSDILKAVLNILSFVVGVVAIIMIIIGAIRFITSQGDGNSTASARNTIIYAIVGLVIAVMAQALVHFVIGRVTQKPPDSVQPTSNTTPVSEPVEGVDHTLPNTPTSESPSSGH